MLFGRKIYEWEKYHEEMVKYFPVGSKFTYLGTTMIVTNIRPEMRSKFVYCQARMDCDYRASDGEIKTKSFSYNEVLMLKDLCGRING